MDANETPATETRLEWEAPILVDLGNSDSIAARGGIGPDSLASSS